MRFTPRWLCHCFSQQVIRVGNPGDSSRSDSSELADNFGDGNIFRSSSGVDAYCLPLIFCLEDWIITFLLSHQRVRGQLPPKCLRLVFAVGSSAGVTKSDVRAEEAPLLVKSCPVGRSFVILRGLPRRGLHPWKEEAAASPPSGNPRGPLAGKIAPLMEPTDPSDSTFGVGHRSHKRHPRKVGQGRTLKHMAVIPSAKRELTNTNTKELCKYSFSPE